MPQSTVDVAALARRIALALDPDVASLLAEERARLGLTRALFDGRQGDRLAIFENYRELRRPHSYLAADVEARVRWLEDVLRGAIDPGTGS